MNEAEESVHTLKAMKLNKKSTEDEINALKNDFKEYFSAYYTNYFTDMEIFVDVQHKRHTKCSCVKHLFDAANFHLWQNLYLNLQHLIRQYRKIV